MVATDQLFRFDLDRRWAPLFSVLGVDDDDRVAVTADGRLTATFGRWKVETPLSNIERTEVTGPHRWYTAVGLRLSLADSGLTMGTNHRRGLCIEFAQPIPKVIGFRKHAALWVSVADPEGLAGAIGR